jgi:hypothetical protein
MSPVYIARVKEVAARSIGGEMMIMSARDSMLFSLNETATAIWQAADGATPLAEIVQRSVCARFEVDAATALRDAEELVEGLAQHGILKVSNLPIEETP